MSGSSRDEVGLCLSGGGLASAAAAVGPEGLRFWRLRYGMRVIRLIWHRAMEDWGCSAN